MDALDTIHAHDKPKLEGAELHAKWYTPILIVKHISYVLLISYFYFFGSFS